jgi:NAD(P)-dependent dehydrogenase (short-subunit alcohol dehydrogenase family)
MWRCSNQTDHPYFTVVKIFFRSKYCNCGLTRHTTITTMMWTGNLSYWLLTPQPPGRILQKLNEWLHQELIDTIVTAVYWCFVFGIGAPSFAMIVMCIASWKVMMWCIQTLVYTNESRNVLEKAQASCHSEAGESIELAVLVTGCDTGFGKELAVRLLEQGFVVFVGCLQEKSMTTLFGQQDKIRPILLDVTKDDQVKSAATTVEQWLSTAPAKQRRYLHAIVNNAGIGKVGYVDWVTLSDFEQCMDVNCWGHIRITKVFLPIFKRQATTLLKSKKNLFYAPQIMNMISMASTSRGGMSLLPYEVSKTAALAFSDGLRLEMKSWKVRVVDVNPSFHTTPLTNNIYERLRQDLWAPLSEELKEEYGQEFFENYARHVERLMSQQWDPSITITVMVRALLSSHPPCRINVGMDSRYGLILYSMFPTWLRNLCTQLFMPDQTPAIMRDSIEPFGSKKED